MSEALHKTIADATKVVVDSLNLTSLTCVVRAEIKRVEGDHLPLCIVTMGNEHHDRYLTGGNVLRMYEIVVSLLYASNQKLETNIGDAKLSRQRIRQTIEHGGLVASPLVAAVAGVYDVIAADMPSEDTGAFDAGYQTARLGLVVKTSEMIRG